MENRTEKRIMLVGRSTAGKTTLCQRMGKRDLAYHKTQTVQIINQTMIDTPGEYLERRSFRGALMVTSVEADYVVFVQSATEDGTMFPPSYNSQFAKPVLGVVTKSDIATPAQVEKAEKYLHMAGAKTVFITSSVTGEGVDALMAYLGYDQDGEAMPSCDKENGYEPDQSGDCG
ncbi:MAG: EutP/PduV family microcompartment system protein [Agathobaculum sp.]|jgi:ethanolamine utilization protein EutP|uniref:EutP/PduV family microcompartment system protein n=1 Tax=Agathobaculum sp. TaxID=2048138 RepID=UPI003D9371D6